MAKPKCSKCDDTGVCGIGNNDRPCDCPASATALFNVVGFDGPITGDEIRRGYTTSCEPIPPGVEFVRVRDFSGGDELAVIVERVAWFSNRIVFEIVRENADGTDIVEWTQMMPLPGGVDHKRFQRLAVEMHKIARSVAQMQGVGEKRFRKRWRTHDWQGNG
jgi:hypothetical protein